MIKGVDLNVRRGEVVGIAGLMGAGRTEFAMSVFGRSYGRSISGAGAACTASEIDVEHGRARRSTHGIAYVTEDRKTYGLILDDDIKHNITLANLAGVSERGVIDDIARARGRQRLPRASCNIRCSERLPEAVNLSGGNQQKVVLSKWLFADPEVLILDEPTRGIDVGAKYEIYTHHRPSSPTRARASSMISSEMPELLGICDRIYVMNEGRFVGEIAGAEASQEKIMRAIVRSGEQRHERRDRMRRTSAAADRRAPGRRRTPAS